LRKALGALEQSGVLWRHVGKGTFLAEPAIQEKTSDLIALGRRLTPFRMMRARLVIEPAIAREAAVNATGDHLAGIRQAMARTRAAVTWAEYEAQDDLFHRHIASASDNLLLEALFQLLNDVRRAVAWGNVVRGTASPPPDHGSFAEHEAIAQAIEQRDPDAAQEAMRRHLRSVSDRLFGEN
jgi:DNA-binding FadR family transcriptional regulator